MNTVVVRSGVGEVVVAYGGDGEDHGPSDSEGWVVKNETAAALWRA